MPSMIDIRESSTNNVFYTSFILCLNAAQVFLFVVQVPDGFIAHFYAISEHVSPVLAFGFLGPRQHLSEVCTTFKVTCSLFSQTYWTEIFNI